MRRAAVPTGKRDLDLRLTYRKSKDTRSAAFARSHRPKKPSPESHRRRRAVCRFPNFAIRLASNLVHPTLLRSVAPTAMPVLTKGPDSECYI